MINLPVAMVPECFHGSMESHLIFALWYDKVLYSVGGEATVETKQKLLICLHVIHKDSIVTPG